MDQSIMKEEDRVAGASYVDIPGEKPLYSLSLSITLSCYGRSNVMDIYERNLVEWNEQMGALSCTHSVTMIDIL